MQIPAPTRRAGLIGAFALIALLLVLVALRATMLFEAIRGFTSCDTCMAATAAQQDASLVALMLAFTGLAFLARRYWLQLPAMLLALSLFAICAIDVALMHTLHTRLLLPDIFRFGGEARGITGFIGIFLKTPSGKLALIGALVAVFIVLASLLPRPHRPRIALFCFLAAVALGVFGTWQPPTMHYVRYELLENVIALNWELGSNRSYSEGFVRQLEADRQPAPLRCEPGQGLHPNLIVLTVESLSAHHSKLFGGMRDLTPRLDEIARSHTWVPNFIANGFATDGGMISLITGHVPIMGRYQSKDTWSGFSDPRGALPDLVHAAGYTAHFFTTGDLGFLNTGDWLRNLKFDSMEGAEAAFYNGWTRRHFNAAEDKALYQRFLQWLDTRRSDQPYAALILTLSTHPPFIDPRTDAPDEAGVFRYADEQIGVLYDELKKRGFFANGVLLISGDHRSMTPLTSAEYARFGDSAMARVPLVVASDLPLARGEVDGLFQQTDVVPSVADLTQAQSCRTPAQGAFLRAHPTPARYALHVRGDKRDEIDVLFDGKQGEIVLDGDATRWQGDRPADWQQIMNGILLDRIHRNGLPPTPAGSQRTRTSDSSGQ